MSGGGEHVSGAGGGVGPDPRDVALHGHPGDTTPEPGPGPVTAADVAAVLTAVGVRLHPRQYELIAAWAAGDPGPPYPIGTVLVSPDSRIPTVWIAADDDTVPFAEVDPRETESHGWAGPQSLPERPVVVLRGPEVDR